jgi:hypothetical protein
MSFESSLYLFVRICFSSKTGVSVSRALWLAKILRIWVNTASRRRMLSPHQSMLPFGVLIWMEDGSSVLVRCRWHTQHYNERSRWLW